MKAFFLQPLLTLGTHFKSDRFLLAWALPSPPSQARGCPEGKHGPGPRFPTPSNMPAVPGYTEHGYPQHSSQPPLFFLVWRRKTQPEDHHHHGLHSGSPERHASCAQAPKVEAGHSTTECVRGGPGKGAGYSVLLLLPLDLAAQYLPGQARLLCSANLSQINTRKEWPLRREGQRSNGHPHPQCPQFIFEVLE